MWPTKTKTFTSSSEPYRKVCQPFLSLKGLQKHDLILGWFNNEVEKDSIWTGERHSVWVVCHYNTVKFL